MQGGKRCINVLLCDASTELPNDDEDNYHDPTGQIGNALRERRQHQQLHRRRRATTRTTDAHDDDAWGPHRRRHTHTTDEQRRITKTHVRGMGLLACNTHDRWWRTCRRLYEKCDPTTDHDDDNDAHETQCDDEDPTRRRWTWKGHLFGTVVRRCIDYAMIGTRSQSRLTTGWTANIPGVRSDHKMIGQTIQIQDIVWSADQLRRRGRLKPIRWKLHPERQ